MRNVALAARAWATALVLFALLGAALAVQPPVAARRAAQVGGLTAGFVATPSGLAVRIQSPERFALTIDGAGIAAWQSLAADPHRNLVLFGTRLLAQSNGSGGAFVGAPRLLAASPVQVVVRLESPAGAVTYSVWAGGQVAVEATGAAALGAELLFDPTADSGATLQPLGAGAAMLYLDAWTPDEAAPGDSGVAIVSGAGLAEAPRLDATNTLVVAHSDGRTLQLTPPAGVLRQPRFRVAGWPGPATSLTLAGQPLVAGVDYLAHWDAASGALTMQYLGLLTAGADAARTFSLTPAQAPALSLELLNQDGSAPRSLSPEGLLRVDANLPAQTNGSTNAPAPGEPTTKDIFDIPYIQTWRELRLRATVANAPAGFGGVRFVVTGPNFTQTLDDTSAADGYTALVSLPRRAEYSVVANALVEGQPAEPSKLIAKAAYGRVFVGIGDSITAGQWGFYRFPGGDGYPFTAPPPAGGSYPVSADGRNYPQSDNFDADLTGYANPYFQGYLVELNNALTSCLNSPVFILNDGVSGIRTARDSYKGDISLGNPGVQGYKNVLGKAAALRGHVRQLGAGQLLLQVGTNDATTVILNTSSFNDPVPASVYNQDLRDVITAMRLSDPALNIWLARLPWRNDKRTSEVEGVQALKRAKTQAFNVEIASIASSLGAGSSTFLGPDFYSHFEANQGQIIVNDPSDTTPPIRTDYLHPTAEGFTAMATLWAQNICTRIPTEPPPDPVGCGLPGAEPCPDSRPFKLRLPLLRS